MSDYISREEFENRIKPYDTSDSTDKALYNFAHNTLICCPSADVRENIHGEWIDNENGTFTCNKCGEIVCCNGKFCCECGADMRGEAE